MGVKSVCVWVVLQTSLHLVRDQARVGCRCRSRSVATGSLSRPRTGGRSRENDTLGSHVFVLLRWAREDTAPPPPSLTCGLAHDRLRSIREVEEQQAPCAGFCRVANEGPRSKSWGCKGRECSRGARSEMHVAPAVAFAPLPQQQRGWGLVLIDGADCKQAFALRPRPRWEARSRKRATVAHQADRLRLAGGPGRHVSAVRAARATGTRAGR